MNIEQAISLGQHWAESLAVSFCQEVQNIAGVSIHDYPSLDQWMEDAFMEFWDCEEGAQQYTEFSFIARELNQARDPDEMWDMFEGAVVEKAIEELTRYYNPFFN